MASSGGENDEEIKIINEMLSSDQPDIRMQARRMRMNRLEVLAKSRSRACKMHNLTCYSENSVKLTASEIQLKTSSEIVAELLEDTQFSITNVRRAAIKKEEYRQEKIAIEREEVKELIVKEAEIAEHKFHNIDSQWQDISLEKDPLNIHGKTENQREKCVDLLEQKDSIIDELKLKLKDADSNFFEELLLQNQYVNILNDRINDQINLMAECYRQELVALENEIESEKNNLLSERRQKWNELQSEKEQLEMNTITERYEFIDRYALNLDSTLVELHEKMRKKRGDCQNEIQDFSLELDSLKNACLLNLEKLQYNFHLLQIRRGENYEMKSQQKRALNRLQDQISSLKESGMKQKKEIESRIVKLRKELTKTTESMAETQRRLVILASTSDRKFCKLWDYNKNLAQGLVNELIDADKFFCEELFGKVWTPPSQIDFTKESMESYNEAVKLVKGKIVKQKPMLSQNDGVKRVLKAFLASIGQNSDYIMDEKLERIIECLSGQNRSLIIADKLFQLLGVKSSSEAKLMAQVFASYVKCATCGEKRLQDEQTDDDQVLELVDQTVKSQIDLMALMARQNVPGSYADDEKGVSESHGVLTTGPPLTFGLREELPSSEGLCAKLGHQLVFDHKYFSKALNEFLEEMREGRSSGVSNSGIPLSVSRSLNVDEIKQFWCQLSNFFDGKVQTWKALLNHMKEYYKLLLKRQFHSDSIKKLKASNVELRRLLQGYITTKDLTVKQLEIDAKFRSAIFDQPSKSPSSLDLD